MRRLYFRGRKRLKFMIEKKLQPAEEEIARYAYYLWEAEGRIHGRDLDYWLQAQAHLKAHREYEEKLLALPKNIPENPPAIPAQNKPAKSRRQNRAVRAIQTVREPAYA